VNPRIADSIADWDGGSCDIADLVSDSSSGAPDTLMRAGLVRGTAGWRQLSFRASGLTVELTVTAAGATRKLVGQLLPRQSAQVDIRSSDSRITVQADDLGRFTADGVPAGPVSIRCRLGSEADVRPVITGWISI
jgi:hypothetical protein